MSGLFPEEIAESLREAGVPTRIDQARRMLTLRLVKKPDGARPARPVRPSLQAAADEHFDLTRLEVVERACDPADGFVKYLFRSPDGALSEAVRIPLLKPDCFSICLSSQVGCDLGCTFCATGRLGLTRNLRAWEMVDAFAWVRDEAPGRVTGALFMGQGEPFQNYEQVIRTARLLSHPCGGQVRAEAISISTVGVVPQILRYAREGHRFRLIVSLTSAIQERRDALMPGAARWPLVELADAIREYARAIPGFATVGWVLLAGVNDGPEEVEALRELLGDVRIRVNLIDVNDPRPDGFRQATDAERRAFVRRLQILRAPVVRRYSGGVGRHAACGMLASTRWEDDGTT
jgi:23S rRNA (adenine2503-C2)-methyltransferase